MPEMIPVKSSNIAAIGWEATDEEDGEKFGTLTVQFTNGRTYAYSDVEEHQFHALRDAPSVGKAFAAIKGGGYDYEQVG